jgi:hypothetical protein
MLREMEVAMNALLTLTILTLLRLVIPFGLLLLLGTLVQRREASHSKA